MFLARLKHLISSRQVPTRILRGPFRGAVIQMSRRHNLRKIFGLYEHVLNPWMEQVLPRINTVLDVGANEGYFTFGCAAAFRRLGKTAEILAFEPSLPHCQLMEESRHLQPAGNTRITVYQTLVGKENGPGMTTLDEAARAEAASPAPGGEKRRALVKIDVEGAEVDVIEGAKNWLRPEHYFLIEVHSESLLAPLEKIFSEAGIKLKEYAQRPLPIIGGESRVSDNRWLVTALD